MKRLILTTLATAAAFIPISAFGSEITFRRGFTWEDAHAATFRVEVNGARGTATFIGSPKDRPDVAVFLTNYHVVTKNNEVNLTSWGDHLQRSIRGDVVWRAYNVNAPWDFAVIWVNAATLKREIDPPYIQIAGPGVKPGRGAKILSAGCPDGRFAQSWGGSIVDYYDEKTAVFTPPPVPGQSGSGIFEVIDGELYQVGVLTWLFGEKGRDDSTGGAIPISNLYDAARGVSPAGVTSEPAVPENATECDVSLTSVKTTVPVVGAAEKSGCKVDAVAVARAANATSCFFFFKNNCPACDRVRPELLRLAKEGYRFDWYNTDTPIGNGVAAKYGVFQVPSAILVRITPNASAQNEKICDVPLDKTPYFAARAAFEQEFIALSERFTSCPVEPVALKGNACASVVYGDGDDAASFKIDANANADFEIVDLDESAPTGIPAQLDEPQKTSENAPNLQENESKTPDSPQKTQENALEMQKDAEPVDEKTVETPSDAESPDEKTDDAEPVDNKSQEDAPEADDAASTERAETSVRTAEPVDKEESQESKKEDFRNREPVWERLDPRETGILDDATERWNNRGKRDETPSDDAESPEEDAQASGLGSRAFDRIAERVEKSVDAKLADAKADIAKTWREKGVPATRRLALYLTFAFLGAVVVGNLLTTFVKRCFRWIWLLPGFLKRVAEASRAAVEAGRDAFDDEKEDASTQKGGKRK